MDGQSGPRPKVWPHRGLVTAVVPAADRRGGLPGPVAYIWRQGDIARERDVAAYLAALRAQLCPGADCQRLARRDCLEVCAQGGVIDAASDSPG